MRCFIFAFLLASGLASAKKCPRRSSHSSIAAVQTASIQAVNRFQANSSISVAPTASVQVQGFVKTSKASSVPSPSSSSAPAVTSSSSSAPVPSTTSSSSGLKRGLAGATLLAQLTTNTMLKFYYDWASPPNQGAGVEYIPMLWGSSQQSIASFQSIMSSLTTLPSTILAFNEPDLASQADISPSDAASIFKQLLTPYAAKGVDLVSPAVAFNMTWMQEFMVECTDCEIGAIAVHWYGAVSELSAFQTYVENMHNTFNLPVLVTEFGCTQAAGGSDEQVLQFLQDATEWMESQDYITAAAFFGDFNPAGDPGDYASTADSFLDSNNQLTPIGKYWVQGT